MEPTIKDKYIILGFIGVAICLISFFITLIVSASFNQDNFVRLIVFVCSNILGWLLYLSFQTVIFDSYEIWKLKSGKKKASAGIIKAQEEQPQDANEPAAPTPMPTGGEATPDIKPVEIAIAPELHEKNRASYEDRQKQEEAERIRIVMEYIHFVMPRIADKETVNHICAEVNKWMCLHSYKPKPITGRLTREITNPENSYRYKVYKNNIKYYKEIIKNSKTPEQKRLEDENNKKIKLLNDKISALKKELSQKTIDSAKTPELKKEIKEKTAQIKDLHAQTQQFLKESLSDEVKKAIEKVNRLNNECKKLLQDSIQDPQEIIQKLVILSATYNGYDNQFFEDFLKKMNPKTPQGKEEFNKLVSKKLYDFLDCEYDKKTAERLNLEHSKYFASLFLTGDDFKENFGILFDLLKKHPDKSIREIMDSLDRNIHTCLALEKRGINYTRWANADKNSYIKVKIETDVDKAQKSAVLNLEKDFNDPAFDQIPEEARKNLVKALKNAGIELLDKKEINYDADGFSDGEKTVRQIGRAHV